MGTVVPIRAARRDPSVRVPVRPPRLRVTLERTEAALDARLGGVSLQAQVIGGRGPIRLYLYVDGDLVESWSEPSGRFELSADDHGAGPHAVTARAVDAQGRWAGASMVISSSGVEAASNE